MKTSDTTSRIKELVQKEGVSIKDFSDKVGFHENTIRNAEKRGTGMSLDTLFKIFAAYPHWDKNYILFGLDRAASCQKKQRRHHVGR